MDFKKPDFKNVDIKNIKGWSLKKKILGGVIVVLLGALGLETTNTDFDLGKLLSGEGVEASKVIRDKEGNVVPLGTPGSKAEDEYNCDDFATQPESQKFYDAAGGVTKDFNRLDGDKDGTPCTALPKGK